MRNHVSDTINDVYQRVEARWKMIQSAPVAAAEAVTSQAQYGSSTEEYLGLLQRYLGHYLMGKREVEQALRRKFKGRESQVAAADVVAEVEQQTRGDFVEYLQGVEGYSQADAEHVAELVRVTTHVK